MSFAITGTLTTGSPQADPRFPRLCVHTWIPDATLAADSAATNRPAIAVRSPITSTYWKAATMPSWIAASWESAREIDYIAAYVRMPVGEAVEIVPEVSADGAEWTAQGMPVQLTKSGSVAWLFERIATPHVRLRVVGDQAPLVATLQAGIATAMPMGLRPGYEPGMLNAEDEYTNTFSEGGQVLGMSLRRTGISESINIEPLKPAWVRQHWPALRQQWRRGGTFLIWNPAQYPRDVVYGVLDGQPRTGYTDPMHMFIRFNLKGPEA